MTLKTILATEFLMRAGNDYVIRRPSNVEAINLQRWHLDNPFRGNGNRAKRRIKAGFSRVAPWVRVAYPPHVFTANLPQCAPINDFSKLDHSPEGRLAMVQCWE